jgi:hypothetical protein
MVTEVDESLVVFTTMRTGTNLAMDNNYAPAQKPTKAKIKEYMSGNTFISPWGEKDNLWPCTVMDALRGCAPAQVCIEILSTVLYGNGVRVYERDEAGESKAVFDVKQQAWLRQTYINNYITQAATDYWTLANQFPQLIRNKAKKGFGYIANISAPFNRLGSLNKDKTGVDNIYINGSWDKMPKVENCTKVPLLNRFDALDQIKDNPDVDKFMWHTYAYTPGNIFYHDHPWHALVRNGTLDIFPEIPKIRKRRIKNAMFVKYHVRINEMYWWMLCGGPDKGKTTWENMKTEERKKMRDSTYQKIDTHLAGSDNAFKGFFTPTWVTPQGTEINLVTIEKIETEVGESAAFDPDKQSNVADIFLAFGIPSAVANTVLSDTKSRGGGSDIREGNTSMVGRMPMHRDVILEPVEFAMRNTFLEGDEPLLKPNQYLGMDNLILTTLDKSENGTAETNKV